MNIFVDTGAFYALADKSDKFHDSAKQYFSLVDCTSFAVMERLKIVDAFSFDKHFAIYRSAAGQPLIVHPQ